MKDADERQMQDLSRMTKYERMQFLRNLGLNVPDAFLVTNHEDLLTSPFNDFISNKTHISLRTLPVDRSSGDMKTPHHPNTPKFEALPLIGDLLNRGFHVIAQEPINPKNTKWCGAIYVDKDGICHVEIADNPNGEKITVRRVVIDGIIDRQFSVDAPTLMDPEINEAISEVLTPGLREVVFELSWYHTVHGVKLKNLIYWEVRHSGR